MARFDSFLKMVIDQKASDLHFHSGQVPIIRFNSDLVPLPFRVISETEGRRFIMEMLTTEQQDELERTQNIDFVYTMADGSRFRSNVFIQRNGLSAVFRIVPGKLPTLDELLMPTSLRKLTTVGNGLVLITGPTGCGKTTTLAAMIHEINANHRRHIITVEDPIEFLHTPVKSVVTQRQVGKHTESFSAALRSALREAPDVLVVGELRDQETIQLALSAAETGILVFGTLHTNTAAKAVNRIIDAMPDESRDQVRGVLSVLLRGVVAQRLCKRANGDGRVAMLEVLLQNWAISNMIRENKTHQMESYLQSVNPAASGMQSMEMSLAQGVREGLVTLEEALKATEDTVTLKNMLKDLEGDE
ncbi:MAG: PilT/PilU family type 4a pilus ATPase [Deltaproteobacteria bacterium]|nr:PilT/PilU family type 4a pilus ATPase [Deltaproteobacteria bacterium]MBN2671796.1 PilT/PilU family type 4a pilus ATPase [Deltaproteobacteria bacterium]